MNDEITVTGLVSSGKLPAHIASTIKDVLQRMEGQRISITLAKAKKKRSSRQNAFYYGVVVPMVKGLFAAGGDTVSDEFVHRYLKAEIGGYIRVIKLPDGGKRYDVDSSTKLTTQDWEDWMEKIRAWAAQYDLQIPLPNETI